MTKKPLSFATSRQLRPLLARLKRLTHQGLADAPSKIATCLDLTPRRATDSPNEGKIWRSAKIGKITATVEIVWYYSTPLFVYPQSRIATTDEAALLILNEIFGPGDPTQSRNKKGWSFEYKSPVGPGCTLILLFDKPAKAEHQTLFSGALFQQ